jgi:hypothetical protein
VHSLQVNIKMTLTPINQFHNGAIEATTTLIRPFAVDLAPLQIRNRARTSTATALRQRSPTLIPDTCRPLASRLSCSTTSTVART